MLRHGDALIRWVLPFPHSNDLHEVAKVTIAANIAVVDDHLGSDPELGGGMGTLLHSGGGTVDDHPGEMTFAEPTLEDLPHGADLTLADGGLRRHVGVSSAVTEVAALPLHGKEFVMDHLALVVFRGVGSEVELAAFFSEA